MNMQPTRTKISQLYELLLKHWKFIINKKDLYLILPIIYIDWLNRREINWDALSMKNINFPIMLYRETNRVIRFKKHFFKAMQWYKWGPLAWDMSHLTTCFTWRTSIKPIWWLTNKRTRHKPIPIFRWLRILFLPTCRASWKRKINLSIIIFFYISIYLNSICLTSLVPK